MEVRGHRYNNMAISRSKLLGSMSTSAKYGDFHYPLSEKNGVVFGTWNALYDPKEFERDRSDGTTMIGLVPDCRVFICGAEVTSDVRDVNVTNSFTGNTCSISLTNPRGRYEISRADLRKKWREDKDILAAYNYDVFKRVADPFKFDKFMDNLSEQTLGKKTTQNIKKGLSAAKTLDEFLFKKRVPDIRGVTRQIFEVKHFSGINKRIGDIVFDYRDPVYVFFKGRFSPYWYFGFSGIITGWDDTDAYDSSQEISIKCEDVSSVWKRTKLSTKAAFYPYARGENRLETTSQTTRARMFSDLSTMTNFSDLIKIIAFSPDYGTQAYNCHVSSPGKSYTQASSRLEQQDIYTEAKGKLRAGASIDLVYMFTKNNTIFKNTHDTIKASDINYPQQLTSHILTGEVPFSFQGGPNNYSLSPSTSLYLQLNEITIADFQAKNVKPYLDISVRFWESEHLLDDKFNVADRAGTGWKDNRAFGVAGIHPALTYDFINNFNIISNIWEQCYKYPKALGNVIMAPLDQIRASLIGSPTEATKTKIKPGVAAEGTQYNLFRPRLFVILPLKFADRTKGGTGTIDKLGELFDEKNTTVYSYLHEKLKAVEYITYATPMGDIIIEPEMYDSHPLEFAAPIEVRNIVKKDTTVKYRVTSSDPSKKGQVRYDKAYFYDSKANHPFFLMEKDRIRCTQTFKHELIYTSIEVHGGQTTMGLDFQEDQVAKMVTTTAMREGRRGFVGNVFARGPYIADGFEKYFDAVGDQNALTREIEGGTTAFNKAVFSHLLMNKQNSKIQEIIDDFISILENEDISEITYDLSRERKDLALAVVSANIAMQPPTRDENIKLTDTKTKQVIYKGAFSELNNYLGKTVQQLISSAVKTIPGRGKKVAADAKNKSTIKALTGVSIGDYETAIAAFDKKEFVASKASGLTMMGITQLIDAYASTAVESDAIIADIWSLLDASKQQLIDKKKINKDISILTLADEKDLAKQRLYDPRTDLVKLYGYNPAEPVKNSYIKNGEEAYDYARTVFNRYLSKAFEIHMDVIGRPELFLNRTGYCERKDAIGLITNFSVKWSHGGDFASAVTLSYARKNTITHEYILGEIDPFMGSTNNQYFQNESDLYYKWNKMANAGVDTIGKQLNETIAGSQKGQRTVTHTTEKETAIDGSALKAYADISSNIPGVPVATVTAKATGVDGNNIIYTLKIIDTVAEGAVSFKTSTGVSHTNIVNLYDGNLGSIVVGNFLVFRTGSISEGAEISNISGNTITLSYNLNNTYPADTVVTRMDWQLRIARWQSGVGVETRGPFPVTAESNPMFSQTFTLIDIKKSDKWYKGRGIYPAETGIAGTVRLSGGTEVQTITTKVITSKESQKSATATARDFAGNMVSSLTTNAIKGFLPLGGLYSSHDKIGHMDFNKRGFLEKVENMSFARAHSLGQNHIEDEGVYTLVMAIESRLAVRKQDEAQLITLKNDYDITYDKTLDLKKQTIDLNNQIDSAPITEKELLTNKLTDILYKAIVVEDELRSIRAEITKLEQDIEHQNDVLYGTTEKPADVGEHIYNLYIKIEEGDYVDSNEYNKLVYMANCYFYQLYEKHLSLFAGEVNDWRVVEIDPESITLGGHGSSPYYVKRIT